MKTTVVPAAELTAAQIESWSDLQQRDPRWDSPYFRPEFTLAVAAVRDDVEVAVIESAGEAVGFFPYQRGHGGVAHPVGGKLSDFQAVIVRPDVAWNAKEILRACGLKAWYFDHLVAAQEVLRPYHRLVEDSPYLDLSAGYEAYLVAQGRRPENPFPRLASDTRKLERLLGPIRFDSDCRDRRILETLIDWKTNQYLRTKAMNVFAFPWTRALLERISDCHDESFSGVLYALYAGDRLVAARFAMRSFGVLHNWFPVYDPSLAKFSPGKIRDVRQTEIAAAMGIHRIDLGKGMNEHKKYFMSGAIQVATGSVDLRPVRRVLRRQWTRAYEWARESSLRRPARIPARLLFHLREWMAFH